MSIIYAMLAILALGVLVAIAWVFYRSEELEERREELDKYSVYLDERANRIAAENETLKMGWAELRKAKEYIKKEQEGMA